jgi:hypothetical protein
LPTNRKANIDDLHSRHSSWGGQACHLDKNPGRELGVILSLFSFSFYLSFVTPGVPQEEEYHTRTWIQSILFFDNQHHISTNNIARGMVCGGHKIRFRSPKIRFSLRVKPINNSKPG